LSAAQLLIDPEILAYCAIMAAIGLIFLALAHSHEVAARIRLAAPGLLTACACFARWWPAIRSVLPRWPRRIPHGIQPAG